MKILQVVLFSIVLGATSSYAGELRVGATPVPAAEILEFAKPILAKQGINLQIQSFTDYITPDIALDQKNLDASLHQHRPFLEKTSKDRNLHIVGLAPIYLVPLGFYSTKHTSLESLPKQGAIIALPNDPTNYSRALILLHDNNVITLKNPNNLNAQESDIIENKRKLVFKQVEAATLSRIIDSVDAAIIPGNYALQAKLSVKKAFFHEGNKSLYFNILAVRADNQKSPDILKLEEVLHSKEVKEFIAKKYKGEILTAD